MSRVNAATGGLLTEKITVRLNEKRFKHLEQIAEREGFPTPVIVRHLIHRFLEQENRLSRERG